MTNKLVQKQPLLRLLIVIIILVAFAALLGFDLANHGVAWRWLWSVTGEETPLAQIRGVVEYAGNILRAQPQTAPDVPVNHADVNPYGINTFLQQEVEIPKRDQTLRMIAEAGFTMIRQQFPWADIEISGRGDFVDRRNDLNGDGQPDAIDAWVKYDNIVDLAEKYGIQIQARLDNPPPWTHADPAIGDFAPPDDFQDFVNYAVAVADRYKGRIHYYQIWNEPNANGEWGNQPVNPEAYTDLLCRTYNALKAVDPDLVVISGPLSPTVSLTDQNLNEFIFLQRMYDAGAGECFDVMSAQGYGFFSGPTDRRLRPQTLTYARQLYIRDIMVANGDADKSIWISEAAWNAQPEDPSIIGSGSYGIVTQDEAARYMPLAYQRAQEEWPWVGNISYWFFKRPADYEINQAFYYFRMAEPDFTPLPVYDSMKQYITTQRPVLYPGVHQAEHWAIDLNPDSHVADSEGAQFGKAVITPDASFRVYGTTVIVRWRTDQPATMAVNWVRLDDNGQAIGLPIVGDSVHSEALPSGAWNETVFTLPTPDLYAVTLDFAISDGIVEASLDSITVADRTYQQRFIPLAAVGIGLGLFVLVIANALRERRR